MFVACWRTKVARIIYKSLLPAAQWTHYVSVMKTNLLILYTELITVLRFVQNTECAICVGGVYNLWMLNLPGLLSRYWWNRESTVTAATSVLRLVSKTDDFADWESCYHGLTGHNLCRRGRNRRGLHCEVAVQNVTDVTDWFTLLFVSHCHYFCISRNVQTASGSQLTSCAVWCHGFFHLG